MILCSYDAASVIDRLFFKSACRFYPSGFSSSPPLPLPPLLPPLVAISSPLVEIRVIPELFTISFSLFLE